MAFRFLRFYRGPMNRLLKIYKYYCIAYAVVELILIAVSAGIGLFMQFYVCITSVSAQAFALISVVWTLYKLSLDSIKITLIMAGLGELIAIIIYPIMAKWSAASELMCSDILKFSSNTTAKTQCTQLLTARNILTLSALAEIVLKILWIIICLIGYKGKKDLMAFLADLREQRRLEKERELEAIREKERRRKERRRKELKEEIVINKGK